MKKIILVSIFFTITRSATCDVIFFPYAFNGISYSLELISSRENFRKPYSSTDYWAGCGFVGSLIYPGMKSFGFETAIETRSYFKPDKYKHFFLSLYLGCALMTDLKSYSTIGFVPGFKLNYKSFLSRTLVVEPYISLSYPLTHSLSGYHENYSFPSLTFGARFGLNSLHDKRKKS
ncbi:MAG TPA: hypothetical protein VMT63_11560 [Bacteroidales bacterium]|nr:hypothetical protein [Bacteroidales bacterium]